MAGITVEQAQRRLDDWLEADEKVAGNQSYELGGRRLTRADAAEIRRNIDYWDKKVRMLSGRGRGPRVRYGVTD